MCKYVIMAERQKLRRFSDFMIIIGLFAAVLSLALPYRANAQNPTTSSLGNSNNGVKYFIPWNDPTENAFTVLIPKGWTVEPFLGFS